MCFLQALCNLLSSDREWLAFYWIYLDLNLIDLTIVIHEHKSHCPSDPLTIEQTDVSPAHKVQREWSTQADNFETEKEKAGRS